MCQGIDGRKHGVRIDVVRGVDSVDDHGVEKVEGVRCMHERKGERRNLSERAVGAYG